MAFVCMVVGMASAISMIMQNGKIIDTIAYYACMPLQGLGSGLASVGISIVVLLLNFFIPSATAKAAALIPIIQPMAEKPCHSRPGDGSGLPDWRRLLQRHQSLPRLDHGRPGHRRRPLPEMGQMGSALNRHIPDC